MIRLPYGLGGRLRDELDMYRRKNNVPEPEEVKALSVHARRDTFLESEFELIKELHINDEVLEYIDLFPNLTSISFDLNSNLEQSDIQHIINKYPNLTSLSIIGQSKIQYIDVSNLNKLQELSVMNNKSLHRIAGLEKLTDMFHFSFYNNETYNVPNEVCKAALNYAYDGADINLDVLFYPNIRKIIEQDQKFAEMFKLYNSNIKWNETVGLGTLDSNIEYTTGEIGMAYQTALNVINNYIVPSDTTELKYAILYQWMCENVKYDYEALDNNHTHSKDGMQVGRKGGTNGTVNALVHKSCVCQGYSKGMQMLLKVADIPAFDVECVAENQKHSGVGLVIDGRRHANVGDHSIQKVNLNGKVYYSDVTWDASMYQNGRDRKYFLLSKNDMSIDHKLIGERNVVSPNRSYTFEEQEKLLEIAKKRIKLVNEELQRKKEEQSKKVNIPNLHNMSIEERVNFAKSMISNYSEDSVEYKYYSSIITQNSRQKHDAENKTSEVNTEKTAQDKKVKIDKKFIEQTLKIHLDVIRGYQQQFIDGKEIFMPVLKTAQELSQEQGKLFQRIEQLYEDGDLDFITKRAMQSQLGVEIDYLKDRIVKINNTNQNSQPQTVNNTPPKKEEKVEKIDNIPEDFSAVYDNIIEEKISSELREKYGYDEMSEEEQERFDSELHKHIVDSQKQIDEKDSLADMRKKAWEKMKKEYNLNPDLDLDIFIRQQEFNEIQRQQDEEIEKIESSGRRIK